MADQTSALPNVKQSVPFFMVTDMAASINFYIQGLGFELTNKWEPNGKIEWCWLQLGGAAIMLQEYRIKPNSTNLGEGVSVCFMCEDALAIYEEALSRSLNAKEPFVGNTLWVVEFTDPDGYHIFFESSTTVPEGTRFNKWKKLEA